VGKEMLCTGRGLARMMREGNASRRNGRIVPYRVLGGGGERKRPLERPRRRREDNIKIDIQ